MIFPRSKEQQLRIYFPTPALKPDTHPNGPPLPCRRTHRGDGSAPAHPR